MNWIVTDHHQYTGEKVSTLMSVQVLLYDKYDKANDKAAREYLLDSLELDFCCDIKEQSRDINTFPELYMILIRVITDSLMEHWEQVKSAMRMLDPTSAKYEAENITVLTRDFATYARPLKAVGKYEHELTDSLMNSILKAKSWSDTAKFMLLTFNSTLVTAIHHIQYLDRSAANAHMAQHGLLYTDVIEKANNEYHTLANKGEWFAKRGIVDKRTSPPVYGANKATTFTLKPKKGQKIHLFPEAQFNSLQQTNSHQTQIVCYNCGGPHYKRDCPQLHEQSKGNSFGPPRNKNFGRTKPNATPAAEMWKKTGPGAGEPNMKRVNGEQWYWCATCNHWNRHPTTEKHVKGYNAKKNKNKYNNKISRRTDTAHLTEVAAEETIGQGGLSFEPSAWHVTIYRTT
ncbi:hypothetical protein ACA910_020004 [Epithemia clementina (nom. ined.)]